MIGIICAMDIEINLLRQRTENAHSETVMGFEFTLGTISGKKVVLVKCGIGKVNAAVCCQTMLMHYKPDLIVNSGVAGSLTAQLEILDVAIAADVVQHDVDTTALGDPPGMVSTVNVTYFPCDTTANTGIMKAAQQCNVRAQLSRIASGEQFVSTAQRKQEIVDLFSAHACDMEAGAIAQACYIAQTPCAVIRAISDATDEDHQLEFPVFASKAADNAAAVLVRYLATL